MKKLLIFGLLVIIAGLVIVIITNDSRFTKPSENKAETTITTTMKISSPAFGDYKDIPAKYTCDGQNISPPLQFSDVPPHTASLTLLVEDIDVPTAIKEDGLWDHWLVWNIPPTTTKIEENSAPAGIEGKNSSGSFGYEGPCPPNGEHRYVFKLFALDTTLPNAPTTSKQELITAMQKHILASAELTGIYAHD